MTTYYITEAFGYPDLLDEHETLVVTQTGSVIITVADGGDYGISYNETRDYTSASVFGFVSAPVAGIFFANFYSTIVVGVGGIVHGEQYGAVIGGWGTVANAGAIDGGLAGVLVDYKGTSVSNTGTLTGRIGLEADAFADDTGVTNLGTISGTSHGLWLRHDSQTVNGGLIEALGGAGGIGALLATVDGEVATFTNSGTLRGAIALQGGDGQEAVRNTGLLAGDVSLLGGDDSYDGRGGRVTGVLDLGDGNDAAVGGAESETILGGAGNDSLAGGAGNDTLTGGGDDDTLSGGEGIDRLAGGAGDDTYVVDDAGDAIVEIDGEGIDTILASLSHTLGDAIENLVLTGHGTLSGFGNALANAITGNDNDNQLAGGGGADTLSGGGGNDTYVLEDADDTVIEAAGEGIDIVQSLVSYALGANIETLLLTGAAGTDGTGNGLRNLITGNGGANRLDGGGDGDTLSGGGGDDTYVVDHAGDHVVEEAGQGTDTVLASVSVSLSAFVEQLVLTGIASIDGTGNSLDNILTGNGGNNRLDGAGGADRLAGLAGDDTYVVDDGGDVVTEAADEGRDRVLAGISYALSENVEDLTLTGSGDIAGRGNSGANALTGNAGHNILDGGAGGDTLAGGRGDDIYLVDDAGDVVEEAAGQGTDTVQAGVSVVLSAQVENLTLTGTSSLDGTGNDLANAITGNAGANRLDGGAGADTLAGGDGDDTYVVDEAGDQVVERAGAGIDTVLAALSHRLSGDVENLTLTGQGATDGTGNDLANTITGNAAGNVLDGGAGADVLAGHGGDDTYVVDQAGDSVIEATDEGYDTVRASVSVVLGAGIEHLVLTGTGDLAGTGNALANLIEGNAGHNMLDGGAGADEMRGGGGNDVYRVDDAGDRVVEAAGAGDDTVLAFVSYGLSAQVERLVLMGAGALDGTGNDLANAITGNAGANRLDGGAGADTLAGGDGDDTYVLDQSGDRVVEAAGEGFDTIRSAVSQSLSANVEALVLTGFDATVGIGNDLDNRITGNAAANLLEGGAGNDSLDGGAGQDTALYSGRRADYLVTRNGDGTVTVTDTVAGRDGADVLSRMEFLGFSDETVALVNKAPTAPAFLQPVRLDENADLHTAIGTIRAGDAEGDALTYALLDDAGGHFAIDPATGVLTLVKAVDYEATAAGDPSLHVAPDGSHKFYTIVVRATDAANGNASADTTLTIDLRDINEAPTAPAFLDGTHAATIGGGSADGALIGNLAAVDPEGGADIVYAFDTSGSGGSSGNGNAGGRFKIENGQLKVANLAGIATTQTFVVSVKATDHNGAAGSASSTRDFLITVNPGAPGDTAPDHVRLAEGGTTRTVLESIGASDTVATVTADDDGGTGHLRYTLAANDTFVIDAVTGKITLKSGIHLDYETRKTYDLEVFARDGDGTGLQSGLQTITIQVGNVDEAPETIRINGALSASVVENAAAGTAIGTLSARDPEGLALRYELADDADGRFRLDATGTKLIVANSAAIDFESLPTGGAFYAVTVAAIDAGGLRTEQVLRIDVTDTTEPTTPGTPGLVNRAPTALAATGALTAREYEGPGTTVGVLSATDLDGDSLTYALLTDSGGRFGLVGNAIVVRNGFKLDYEQARDHVVTVQVFDGHGGVAQADVRIGVIDVTPEVTAGSADSDFFKGGAGRDKLRGGLGHDTLFGGGGQDSLTGGAGRDVFAFATKPGGKNVDRITDFKPKDDSLYLDHTIFKALGRRGGIDAPVKLKAGWFHKGAEAHDGNDRILYDSATGILRYDADGTGAKGAVAFAIVKANLAGLSAKDFLII